MVLSWIEDIASEYYRKTDHLVFNNISYFAKSPRRKLPAWQEFDILTIKDGRTKIVSCKRGLSPAGYDRQAELLHFHRENLLENSDLKKYRDLVDNPPELVLLIEYPRDKHVERIKRKGIIVEPFNEMLRSYVILLRKELQEHKFNEGKEPNYASRLLKGLLVKKIIEVREPEP